MELQSDYIATLQSSSRSHKRRRLTSSTTTTTTTTAAATVHHYTTSCNTEAAPAGTSVRSTHSVVGSASSGADHSSTLMSQSPRSPTPLLTPPPAKESPLASDYPREHNDALPTPPLNAHLIANSPTPVSSATLGDKRPVTKSVATQTDRNSTSRSRIIGPFNALQVWDPPLAYHPSDVVHDEVSCMFKIILDEKGRMGKSNASHFPPIHVLTSVPSSSRPVLLAYADSFTDRILPYGKSVIQKRTNVVGLIRFL